MKKRRALRNVFQWALLATLCVIMLRWFEYHQVYHPGREMAAAAADLGRPFETSASTQATRWN